MHRAIRTQVDSEFEAYSLRTGIDFSDAKDLARQEFKAETDVNQLLGRFGVGALGQRQQIFTETDFGLDLQTALEAVEMSRQAHRQLPRELREKYPTWQALLNGLYTGQFKMDLSQVPADEIVDPLPDPAEKPAPEG